MIVKIGHAYSDERSRARGGKSGDQTGKEVLIQNWYNKGWSAVFRAKEANIAEKIAKAAEQACLNNKIGYDQGQRTTLYEQAKKLDWDISKITEDCECDCSSLVSVCVNAAGISVSKDMYTGNQKAVLQATKKFDILTSAEYLTAPNNLKRGDILLGPGHTAIVVSCSKNYSIDTAKSFSKTLAGNYEAAANLNLRCGAGTDKNIIVTMPKGTRIKCYGYYTKVLQTNWLYVQIISKNEYYTGFVSSKYISRNN